jgi:hypothetical protein
MGGWVTRSGQRGAEVAGADSIKQGLEFGKSAPNQSISYHFVITISISRTH